HGDGSHVYVYEHYVEARAPDHLDRFLAPSGDFHDEAFAAENARTALPQRSIVVDDQGAELFGGGSIRGREVSNCAEVFAGQGAIHRTPSWGYVDNFNRRNV